MTQGDLSNKLKEQSNRLKKLMLEKENNNFEVTEEMHVLVDQLDETTKKYEDIIKKEKK